MRKTKQWLDCGHTTVQPDMVGKELHGQLWTCPKCACEGLPVVYKWFVWDCGHNFFYSPDQFDNWTAEWEKTGVAEIGKCLNCPYPVHRPISGQCEICGKEISIKEGTEMVCDDCLPSAMVESLHHIGVMLRSNLVNN